jgi:large subunit ribosomal protein L24
MKLKKGDTVVVIAGKDKGAQGEIAQVFPQGQQGHRRGGQHRDEAPEVAQGERPGRPHRP